MRYERGRIRRQKLQSRKAIFRALQLRHCRSYRSRFSRWHFEHMQRGCAYFVLVFGPWEHKDLKIVLVLKQPKYIEGGLVALYKQQREIKARNRFFLQLQSHLLKPERQNLQFDTDFSWTLESVIFSAFLNHLFTEKVCFHSVLKLLLQNMGW